MKLRVEILGEQDRVKYEACLLLPKHWQQLTFYHTWEWGEVIAERATKMLRVGLYDESDVLRGVGQFGLHGLKFGRFWYSPRGVLMDYGDGELVAAAYTVIREYFRGKDGAGFVRLDPNIARGSAAESVIDTLRPKKAAIFTQAERVWVVELQQDVSSLLAWLKTHGMRSNVPRYLRKATKAGVTVRASSEMADLEKLITMLNALDERKGGIGKHKDEYYRQQFRQMAPAGYEKVFLAEKDGEVLACSLVTIYGKEASYLHGASASTYRDLSAPHTLHIETMQYLQAHHPKVELYNFWGVVGDKNRTPKHPRHGYSEFKRSFGGYKQHYARSRDFVYKPLVWRLAWLIDSYRTWKYKND